jgi:hypothetical protein
MKNCPYCSEQIQDSAKKCRFCGEFIPDNESTEQIEKPHQKAHRLMISESSENIGIKYYLSPIGRMNKKHYSMVLLLLFIVWVGCFILMDQKIAGIEILTVPAYVLSLYILVMSGVKRFHDFNMSGWHTLWTILILAPSVIYFCLV